MPKNIFQDIPAQLPEELFETLLQRPGLKVERIVSKGHLTPEQTWYDQAWDEWILLIQGHAVLGYADQWQMPLKPGDYLLIPAHTRHRVLSTAPEIETIWLALHLS